MVHIRIVISCGITLCSLVGVTNDSEKPTACLKIPSAGFTEFLELSAELHTVTNQKATFSLPRINVYFSVETHVTFVQNSSLTLRRVMSYIYIYIYIYI